MRITSDNKSWPRDGLDFVKFIVCGVIYKSRKRFRLIYDGTFNGYHTAININLYNGTVWGVLDNGKRKLIKRVNN